jgi:hypothetical protein
MWVRPAIVSGLLERVDSWAADRVNVIRGETLAFASANTQWTRNNRKGKCRRIVGAGVDRRGAGQELVWSTMAGGAF